MSFTRSRDTVRVKFEDTKQLRKKIRNLKIRFYNQLVDLLPSTYTDESASANYSIHLLALAEEFARIRCNLDTVLADMSYEELRSFLLYQNLGSILGFRPDEDLSHEEYRRLLLAILSVLLGGARPENIKRGVEIFTDFNVKVTEVFKALQQIEDDARRSALNISDSILTKPNVQCGGHLTLNSEPLFGETFLGGSRRFVFFVDILILDAVNPKFIDKGGTVSGLLELVKPAHTEFLLRNIFLEEFNLGEIVEEEFTKVELGVLSTSSGSALNNTTDLLTQPLGPGTNTFILSGNPVIGFVALSSFFV